jgi:hypothetical protein
MKHRILKTKTINNLQDDVCNCISDSTKIKFVQNLSDKLLEHEEVAEVAADNVSEQTSTKITSLDDGKEEKTKDVCFFDYDPPNDWYITLFNTILDYCASNKITDTDTLKQGIKDLLTLFLKYDDVIHYLQTAKRFVVIQSEHFILDTENNIKWNTINFEKSYKSGRSYLVQTKGKIQKKSFSKIFADSEICSLFKEYNKSDFKPYNPLKEKVALPIDTYNYYKPVFKEEPLVDKNLEQRFRYGARFLLDALWDFAEHDRIKYKWLLGYIAHTVQYPAVTVQQCLAINGIKRCGKNTIFGLFAELFGSYGFIKQNLNSLTGTFNTDLYHNVICVYDETKDVKTLDRIIKSIVGNSMQGITRKGIDAESIECYAHIIFLSNEIDVSYSVGERHLVGFFPKHRQPQNAFTRFYENCLNDPSVKEQFLHWLWYQLTMLDFKKLGYDPFVYPEFAKIEAKRIIEEEPQNLEQCVFASMRQWHKELADNLTRLEQAEKITSDIFDKAMLINIKSSIGTKHRYKGINGIFSTPLYSLVLYCARSAFERGFTKIQTKQEVYNGAITSIYCPDWEIIEKIKSILGRIFREYDIYKKKQNDNRYLIPHPAEVLMAIDN